jgi:spoIIIJ-associated protein
MKQQSLNVEISTESPEVAIQKALTHLNGSRADADIEVLQVQSSGLFGRFGKRLARVRVCLHDPGLIARQVTQRLLLLSDLDAVVDPVSSNNRIKRNLTSQDPSFLLGPHGHTLESLKTLVCSITDRLTTGRSIIQLDVDGYLDHRRDFLGCPALSMACKERRSRKPVSTPPLVLSERRIVRDLFKLEPGPESVSRNSQFGFKFIILRTQG